MLPRMTPFVLPKLLTHWGLTFLIVLSLCQTGCWKDTSDVCRRWGHLSSLCNTNRVWGNRKIISFTGCKWKAEENLWTCGCLGGKAACPPGGLRMKSWLSSYANESTMKRPVWQDKQCALNPTHPHVRRVLHTCHHGRLQRTMEGKITARQQDGHRLKAQSNGSAHVTSSGWYYNGWTAVVSRLSRQKCQTDQE